MRTSPLVITAFLFCACNNAETKQEVKNDSTPLTTTVSETHNMLTEAEKAEGWQLLFDGATLNGWHVFNKKSDGSAWKVEDGCVHLDPKEKKDWQTVGGGDLMNENEFESFHLKLQWKIDTGGNSGILLYSQEDPKYEHSWHTGLELQVLDNERHGDRVNPKHRAGDLYDLVSASPETVKPALEWNQVEIKCEKGKLEEWLNGTKVLEITLWDDNFKKLVAGSKFKDMKDFATFTKGRIGVQDHGDKVWYRDIKIRKL
jgi:hypothetical protein